MKTLILIKNIFLILFHKEIDFVFYSENSHYKKYYSLIIEGLLKKDKTILYLSSDFKDKVDDKRVKNFYIGSGYVRYFIFLIIKAKIMILTLTDIGNHELKKNSYISKYIYLFHAVNSAHRAFTQSAFNNYDSILCIGEYQKKEIRELEIFNNSKKKNLLNAGYIYFDYLDKKCDRSLSENFILIAPSWNYNEKNFFNLQSKKIISYLLSFKYKVILRPHPEHYKREVKLIKDFETLSKSENNFILDKHESNIFSMNKSDVLITDCSGIAPEFLFTYKRPIIYFDKYTKIHNLGFKKIDLPVFEDQVKNKFGFVPKDQENFTKNFIEEAKTNFLNNNMGEVNKFAEANFYNFQKSQDTYIKLLTEQLN